MAYMLPGVVACLHKPHCRMDYWDLESDVEDNSEPEGVPMDVEPSGLHLRIALKVKTAVNRFGIWRVYGRRPTAVPDLNLPSNQLNNPKLPLRLARSLT